MPVDKLIRDKTSLDKIEARAVIKFLTKQGKSPQEILEEMSTVLGDNAPGKTTVYKWHGLFKQGRESLEDDSRPGRNIKATSPEIIKKVEKLIEDDPKLSKNQMAEIVGVSDTSILHILREHLGMTKVRSKWIKVENNLVGHFIE